MFHWKPAGCDVIRGDRTISEAGPGVFSITHRVLTKVLICLKRP